MTEVGAYEAKTKLPELLRKVEQGEEIIITHRGRQVAVLRAFEEVRPKAAKTAKAANNGSAKLSEKIEKKLKKLRKEAKKLGFELA